MKVNYDAEPFMVESRVPIGPSRIETHVIVPLALTGITTLAVTAGLVICTWRFGWSWDVPWLGGLVVFLGMWAWRILLGDRLLWKLERVTGRDITGDGSIGDPTITTFNPAAARRKAAQVGMQVPDAVLVRNSLHEFVRLCASVERPTEAALGIPTGDREGYVTYRDALMSLGIAAWNDPARRAAGWHLAVEPEDAARIIAAHVV